MQLETQERFVNYCAVPYTPRSDPTGKWRSRHLLETALEVVGVDPRAREVLTALRGRFGPDRTIWALKKSGGAVGLELYFYNYGREDPDLVPSRVLEVLRPWLRASPELAARCDRMRYFLFSLDVETAALDAGLLGGLHVYLHDVADRATGLSYFVDDTGARLENHYAFYRPAAELQDLAVKVSDTPFVDFERVALEAVLQPEFIECKTICSARKQSSDCVYFSGLGLRQFQVFLERYDYPRALQAWVESNRTRLDHLEFDIGLDYVGRGDRLEIRKTSFDGSY